MRTEPRIHPIGGQPDLRLSMGRVNGSGRNHLHYQPKEMMQVPRYKNAGEFKIMGIRQLQVGSLFKKNRSGGKTFVLLHQDSDDADTGIGYAEWGVTEDGDFAPVGKHRIMRQGQPVLFIDVPPVAVDGDYGLVTSGHSTGKAGQKRRYYKGNTIIQGGIH